MTARQRAAPPMKPPNAATTVATVPVAALRTLLDGWTTGMLQAGQDSANSTAPNWSGGYGAGLDRAIADLLAVEGMTDEQTETPARAEGVAADVTPGEGGEAPVPVAPRAGRNPG